MDQVSILVKAFILGITATTMPLSIFIYMIQSSIQNGKKIGKYIFLGHFVSEIVLMLLTFIGASSILKSVPLYIIVSLLAFVVLLFYGIKFLKLTINGIPYKEKESENTSKQSIKMSDIYSYSQEENREPDKKEKVEYASGNIIAGILLSISSWDFIMFITVSVPAMTFQTNESFGGNLDFLTTLLFLIVFILGELLLYVFLPKIISIVRRWINEKVQRWINGFVAASFFALSISSFISMMVNFKFI